MTVGMVQVRWARTKSLGAAGIWLDVSNGAELTVKMGTGQWTRITVQTWERLAAGELDADSCSLDMVFAAGQAY